MLHLIDLIYNCFLENNSMPVDIHKELFAEFHKIINSQILTPVENLLESLDKEKLEGDFVRSYYLVPGKSTYVEESKKWFYDSTLLEKIINKIE